MMVASMLDKTDKNNLNYISLVVDALKICYGKIKVAI